MYNSVGFECQLYCIESTIRISKNCQFLNRDMGMVPPQLIRETTIFQGNGEVEDALPPPPSRKILKRKRNPFGINEPTLLPYLRKDILTGSPFNCPAEIPMNMDKGK